MGETTSLDITIRIYLILGYATNGRPYWCTQSGVNFKSYEELVVKLAVHAE